MKKQDDFHALLERLQAPFPTGAVKHRNINNKLSISYIEADTYIERLNDIAGEHWDWRLHKDPVFYDREVMVIGTLSIMHATRDGIGTAPLNKKDGQITNMKYALRSASHDALRHACDLFGMGWENLKKTSLSFDSPKEVSITEKPPTHSDICQKCKTPLTSEDQTFLAFHQIHLSFCQSCTPAHLLKS